MTCVQKQIEEAGSERQDRESQRHTAGRWRSLRAPGNPVMKTVGNTTQRVHGMF